MQAVKKDSAGKEKSRGKITTKDGSRVKEVEINTVIKNRIRQGRKRKK